MADEAYLQVVTTAWQTDAVVKSLETIEGVERVVRADKDSGKLVVAIEPESRGSVMKEIGRVYGVIYAGFVGNGD